MIFLIACFSVSLAAFIIMILQLQANLRRYQLYREDVQKSRLEDTPTISLCIPARNETHALEDCLNSVISSDYPKLEVIVLDDCSQDKTSQIIRGFATNGIRFVKGEAPSEGWLGKNNAYETLAKEARGEYLVFMSVDTRVEPTTLSVLIAYMREYKLSMSSVLPRRRDGWRASVIFSPLRYFWQLVLPLGVNTPTATSLWVISSDTLAELGSFAAHKDKIMVENILAKQLFAKSKYRFLVANDYLKVWYAKKWSSQVETAVRLWYPLLQKSTFYSLFAVAAHFLLFVLPLIGFIFNLAVASLPLVVLSLCVLALQSVLFFLYIRTVHASIFALLGIILAPLLAFQEMILIATSIYQYKRGRVDWKGRNICYPVLRRDKQYDGS